MKQIIKNVLSVALAGAAILSVACSEWTEPEIKVIQSLTEPNIEKDDT